MKNLPLARTTDILVQNIDKELLVYDLITNKAYNLNETAKIVFNACDGKTSFEELRLMFNFTDDLIYLSLDRLNNENLLAAAYQSKFAGNSRREIIRRIGLTTLIALPVISSLIAPTAAYAGSTCPSTGRPNGCPCTQQGTCTSGCCSSTPRVCVIPRQKPAGIPCIANCECQSAICAGSPQVCQPVIG